MSGKTWKLSAGPKWFWGTDSPLAAYVGKTVNVVGTYREGSTEVDVTSLTGRPSARRADRRGPVAQRVSARSSPGWKARGAHPGRGLGRDNGPRQVKKNQDTRETE